MGCRRLSLPVALRWLQEGTLSIHSASNWRASLPGNVELIDLLVLFTGRERLLGAVQWPGLLILLFACLHLGRALSKSGVSGWPVVTVTLMIPIVASQSTSGYVDLFGTALLFGSLTLVLEYCDSMRRQDGEAQGGRGLIVAAGLAWGLAVGAKPVYWVYACLLFLGTFLLLARAGGGLNDRVWRQIGLFVVAGAIPCVFWFVRATICTGNPIYPFRSTYRIIVSGRCSPC